MCSDPASQPPVEPARGRSARGLRLQLRAADGNDFAVFRAEALEPRNLGVLVLPDYGGLSGFYEQLALRFAEAGMDAMALDYYGRTAALPPRERTFDHVRHARQTTWTDLRSDIIAAAAALRAERDLDALFSIGFCFGGRTSFLLATLPELDLAGVIGFYGWPAGPFLNDLPAPADVAGDIRSPLLAIFGGADPKITADDVASFEAALRAAQIDHRVVVYEDAPHSFFDRREPAHAAAAAAAWSEVLEFIAARPRQASG